MAAKKRQREEMEAQTPSQVQEDSTPLSRLRNMWEFANLGQFLSLFGKHLKIEGDLSIEALETECLVPSISQKLFTIGFVLLKLISTQRGLNSSMFDEYMQKEYRKRDQRQAESRTWRGMDTIQTENPFGDEPEPKRFNDFDVYAKIQVLQQLTQWALSKPELIREKMNEPDGDQLFWRVDIYGWDAKDREYFLLDDNRLYRREDPTIVETTPEPKAAKPKANSKKGKAAARASRRQSRLEAKEKDEDHEDHEDHEEDIEDKSQVQNGKAQREDTTWELVAMTMDDYKGLLDSLAKSKDKNEKSLRSRILTDVMPIIERAEEEQKRKALKREKELLVLEKLSTAKRSSRVAAKQDREKEEQEALEAARQRQLEEAKVRKGLEKQRKMEEERNHRLMNREHRVQERGARRMQREQELAHLTTEGAKLENGGLEGQGRISERKLKLREADLRRELEELETEDWYFDCPGCGIHGKNIDDGKDIIACDGCNVWQHVKCLSLGEQVLQEDFEFICNFCIYKKKEAERIAREKEAQEKAAIEKAAQDKIAQEKAAVERAAQEKAAREKAALRKAAREKALQEAMAQEKSAAHPPIMLKIRNPGASQSPPGSNSKTLENGHPSAYRSQFSGESSPLEHTIKRPKIFSDVGMPDTHKGFSSPHTVDKNHGNRSESIPHLIPAVQPLHPTSHSADSFQRVGLPGDRQQSVGTQRPDSHYASQRDNSSHQSHHPPPAPLTRHSPPAAVTPNGFARQYQSPYGSARTAENGSFALPNTPFSASPSTALPHLSMPNDTSNSMSPRLHLPPSSSPTANGTSPGTLPHHSAGLSPTKHVTMAGSPTGAAPSLLHSPDRSLTTPLRIHSGTVNVGHDSPSLSGDKNLQSSGLAGKAVQQLSPSVGRQVDLSPPTKTLGMLPDLSPPMKTLGTQAEKQHEP